MEIHIGQGDLEIAVGWEFIGTWKADRVFKEIKDTYSIESNDYNIDLCDNGEIIDTFTTNKANAWLIENIYFEN